MKLCQDVRITTYGDAVRRTELVVMLDPSTFPTPPGALVSGAGVNKNGSSGAIAGEDACSSASTVAGLRAPSYSGSDTPLGSVSAAVFERKRGVYGKCVDVAGGRVVLRGGGRGGAGVVGVGAGGWVPLTGSRIGLEGLVREGGGARVVGRAGWTWA